MTTRFGLPFFYLVLVAFAGWQGFAQPEGGFQLLLEDRPYTRTPFEEGEQLRYVIYWKPLFLIPAVEAGELRFKAEKVNREGRETYLLQGWAESAGALSRIAGFDVRNYYESIIDGKNLRSYRNLQQTRQGTRQRDLTIRFDYENETVDVRETDPSTSPPREIRNSRSRGIPAPVVDVLSAFYVARARELRPDSRYLVYLNERGQFRQVRVIGEKEEILRTAFGPLPSVRLTTVGGLFKVGGELRIWYSKDRYQVPMKFEADVPFGKVFGELVEMQTPRLIRKVFSPD